jgi:hypothetical protein
VQHATLAHPSIWVVKWVDYSNKYGLGYQLSNNIFGAYFNDSTKMVVGSNTKYVRVCSLFVQSRVLCSLTDFFSKKDNANTSTRHETLNLEATEEYT